MQTGSKEQIRGWADLVLARIGITRGVIARHTTVIEPGPGPVTLKNGQTHAEYMRARRNQLVQSGLTTEGKQRQRFPRNGKTWADYARDRRERLLRQGLTCEGKPRTRKSKYAPDWKAGQVGAPA